MLNWNIDLPSSSLFGNTIASSYFKVATTLKILVKLTNEVKAPIISGVYNLAKKTLLTIGIAWAKAVPVIIVNKFFANSPRVYSLNLIIKTIRIPSQ
jgi:hypothetical protein